MLPNSQHRLHKTLYVYVPTSPESTLDLSTDTLQHNFYTEFQPEFDLIVEETNGRVLQ